MLKRRLRKCLQKASEKRCKTVAMTALGIGKLGYPLEFVARTMLSTVADFLEQETTKVEKINFVILPADRNSLMVSYSMLFAFSVDQKVSL